MRNKLKIFLLTFLTIFFGFFYVSDFTHASKISDWIKEHVKISVGSSRWWSLESKMLKDLKEDSGRIISSRDTEPWNFFKLVRSQIFNVILIIPVVMVVWIGVRMATARWNPEEFKKAWMHFIYLILWLFIVFVSWWVVRLVSNLNIF